MDPTDELYDRLTLFNTSMVAHMARILDRNGLLDDATRKLIHLYLPQIAENAERVGDEETAQVVDQLVEILPPSRA